MCVCVLVALHNFHANAASDDDDDSPPKFIRLVHSIRLRSRSLSLSLSSLFCLNLCRCRCRCQRLCFLCCFLFVLFGLRFDCFSLSYFQSLAFVWFLSLEKECLLLSACCCCCDVFGWICVLLLSFFFLIFIICGSVQHCLRSVLLPNFGAFLSFFFFGLSSVLLVNHNLVVNSRRF